MAEIATNQFALLKTRRFLPLFLVLFLGAFNDQVFKNAYVILITFVIAVNGQVAIFGGEMALNTFSLIASILFILPFALISPTAGQVTDNVDKRTIIRFVKITELGIMVLAVICFFQMQVELLMFVLFLLGAQSAVFAPVKYAVMPQYLDKRELLGGNGLAQAATFLAIIFGTILGTQVILFDGGIMAVSVLVMVIALIGLVAAYQAPSAASVGQTQPVDWVLPRAMVKLVIACTARRVPFAAVLYIAWFWFVGATFMALLNDFVATDIGGDKNMVTALLTCFSVGVAIGALLSERVAHGGSGLRTTPWAALAIGVLSGLLWLLTPVGGTDVSLGAFAGSLQGLALFVVFIVLAVASGLYITPMNAMLQRTAPRNQRARFVACSNVVDSLAMVGSAIFGILLAEGVGLSTTDIFLVVGFSGVAMAFVAARLTPGHPLRLGR